MPPYWQIRPGRSCSLPEHDLTAGPPGAALDLAARLLATPRRLAEDDPVSFHLAPLGDGRTLFLVQLNHVLADFKVILPLLREIDHGFKEAGGSVSADAPAPAVDDDPLAAKLRGIPLRRRIGSVLTLLDFRFRQLHRQAAVLGDRAAGGATSGVPDSEARRRRRDRAGGGGWGGRDLRLLQPRHDAPCQHLPGISGGAPPAPNEPRFVLYQCDFNTLDNSWFEISSEPRANVHDSMTEPSEKRHKSSSSVV
jgi:hypothetical protein